MEKYYVAVTCIGRQPDSDVYVLGKTAQFTMKGIPIPQEQKEFVWVEAILDKMGVHINDLSYQHNPDHVQNIDRLVECLLEVTGKDNLISGISGTR
jgi:hypothetical protein